MIVRELVDVIEQSAPLNLQAAYDNSGLIVGDMLREINCGLLCVDVTEEVIDEAIASGVDIIISHHPVIFHPLKKLTGSSSIQRIVEKAIKHNIVLYACHTNLDQVTEGLNYGFAASLGLRDVELLDSANPHDETAGFGVVGVLSKAMEPHDFFRLLQNVAPVQVIRHNDISRDKILKVAICTGSGASLIGKAVASGADVYVSADFKYNDFLDNAGEIILADIGHFESEYCAIRILYDIITKKITNFAVRASRCARNPINYFV